MTDDRDNFAEPTKRLLAERVGFHCSSPSCGVVTIWAAKNSEQKEYVGVAAHIYSASPNKGPRANPALTQQERSSIDNGIHLCNKCSRTIDTNNGANHPVELLQEWKYQAEVRQRARGLTNNNVPVYREVNYERLDSGYKVALACAGLSEKQIKACPLDADLGTHIQQLLTIGNKCAIIGPSGSGKSLLTHQLAEVFYAQGFSVVQLNKSAYMLSQGTAALPTNIVLIIDDGHTLPEHLIDQLFAQATDTTKILMNWNKSVAQDISSLTRIPQVKINEKRQVELLAEYCQENKETITGYLRQMGVKINPRHYHNTIENRIKRAAQELSPWLFNYNLSEGWKTARQDLELLESHNNSHQVVVVIAIFQIVTLDEGVSWPAIKAALTLYSDDNVWQESAIAQAKLYVIDDNGLVKLKHYRYAERLLINYFETLKSERAHAPTVQLLEQLLRDHIYADGHSNLLEFISFDYHPGQYFLSQDLIVTDLTKESIIPDVLPRKVCIGRVYSLVRFNKAQCLLALQGNSVIEQWISEVEASNAIALFWMLNDLIHAGYNELSVSQEMLSSVFDKLSTAPMNSKAFFAKLFSQLVSHGGEDAKNIARKLVIQSNLDIRLQPSSVEDVHWHFSQTFCRLSWINSDWAKATFKANVDEIADRFNTDFFEAEQDYRDIIKEFFGVISAILGSNHPYKNKPLGKLLCSKLVPEKIAASLQQIDYHSIQDYWNFLLFVQIHDTKILNNIASLLDLSILKKQYGKDIKIEHHHRCLLQIIYDSNPDFINGYTPWLLEQLEEYHPNLFWMFPDEALNGLEAGKRLDLKIHVGDECELYIKLLEAIESKGKQGLVQRILIENKDNLANAIFSKSQNVDRSKAKIKLILFANSRIPELCNVLFSNTENLEVLFQKIPRLMSGTKIEKQHAKLYVFLVERYVLSEQSVITRLKKRYPSLRQLTLSKVSM